MTTQITPTDAKAALALLAAMPPESLTCGVVATLTVFVEQSEANIADLSEANRVNRGSARHWSQIAHDRLLSANEQLERARKAEAERDAARAEADQQRREIAYLRHTGA